MAEAALELEPPTRGRAGGGGTGGATGGSRGLFMTNTMRNELAKRDGSRQTIYGVRRKPVNTREPRLPGEEHELPFTSGKTYKGEWTENKRAGYGVEADGEEKYEGQWSRNRRDGKGTLWIKARGRDARGFRKKYAGDWKQGSMTGHGTLNYDDGAVYTGGWQKNRRHGRGRMEYANGDVYDGEWDSGNRSGQGVLRLENGNVYEGMWANDVKEGRGVFFYASTERVYEGEWVDGSPTCGEYRQPTDAEYHRYHDPDAPPPADASADGKGPQRKSFALPALELADADRVLSDAVVDARQARAKSVSRFAVESSVAAQQRLEAAAEPAEASVAEDAGDVMDDAELAQAAHVFSDDALANMRRVFERAASAGADGEEVGLIACADLPDLLAACSISVPVADIAALLEQLSADEGTQIGFEDFVEVCAIFAAA